MVILALLALLGVLHATTADDTEYYLVKDLFRNYDRRLRPSFNHTEVLNVTFGIALQNIMEVSESLTACLQKCYLHKLSVLIDRNAAL